MHILHSPCGIASQLFIPSHPCPQAWLTLRRSRTSNDLDEFAGNDGLTSSVVENLELVDHVTSVLGRIVHGVLASRDLASVALSKSLEHVSQRGTAETGRGTHPEERVGKSVLAEVGENLVLDLESREVGWGTLAVAVLGAVAGHGIPDWVIASSEYASTSVAS